MERRFKIQSNLRIVNCEKKEKAFGPGIAALLEGVETHGSLRKSAALMNMSYSKAWTVLHGCEAQLGFALLNSRIGGRCGGGAELTEEGKRLLENYRAFEKEAGRELGDLAKKYFPGYFSEDFPEELRGESGGRNCRGAREPGNGEDHGNRENRGNGESQESLQGTTSGGFKRPWILVRGAGDLATGIILRLWSCGFRVAVTECRKPSAIRRRAALCEAVWEGTSCVEGARCRRVETLRQAELAEEEGVIPLFVDEEAACIHLLHPAAVIDAILAKRNLGTAREMAPITVGVGPGFTAGEDVDAVVETMRGHSLGRVIWQGAAIPNTGIPGEIEGFSSERVIHSPASGPMRFVKENGKTAVDIGAAVKKGQIIAWAGDTPVYASLDGVLRGLIREGYEVKKGLKIADIDPRPEQAAFCDTVSDKARAVAGGAVEALLAVSARKGIRLL